MGRPMYCSVNGTGIPDPFGPGFAADIGRMLTNPWNNISTQFYGDAAHRAYGLDIIWQPIGYPAAVFPMNPSVEAGVGEISRQVTLHEQNGTNVPGDSLTIGGYSQGALVTDVFWRDLVLNPAGPHHNRLEDITVRGGIINFGDPMHCPGISNGNIVAGIPVAKTLDGVIPGGIAGPTCLTPEQTPDCLLSINLDGDLYGSAPVGPPAGTLVTDGGAPWVNEPLVGQIETRIYNFIESSSLVEGIMAVAEGVAQEFEYPLSNTIALCHAIFNGMTFALAGTNAPHWQYGPYVPALYGWLVNRVSTAVAA